MRFCRNKIAQNVNADEAAVLGAALHGASLSMQFKTKDIKVQDIGVHDIQATYLAAPSASNTRVRSINTVIFPAGSKVGTKKTLTFKRSEDFDVQIQYKHSIAPQVLSFSILNILDSLPAQRFPDRVARGPHQRRQ